MICRGGVQHVLRSQWSNIHISTIQLKKKLDNVKGKSVTAQKWIKRQLDDPYVKLAKHNSYRCRSAFKLIQIDDKFNLMKPGQIVIDCGSSPGSWCQVAVERTNADGKDSSVARGTVFGVDISDIPPIPGATLFPHSDFTKPDVQNQVLEKLSGQKAQLVISDMAPSATGLKDMDDENSIGLCFAALYFAVKVSDKNAAFLCKLWQSGQQKRFQDVMSRLYTSTRIVKPDASHGDSAEIFLLGRGFKGLPKR